MSKTQNKDQTSTAEDKLARVVQKTASLHERAVQAVAEGKVQSAPRRPRKATSSPVQHPVVVRRVAFDALPKWAQPEVRQILDSGHGYTHWEVRDDETVVVR